MKLEVYMVYQEFVSKKGKLSLNINISDYTVSKKKYELIREWSFLMMGTRAEDIFE